MFRTKVAFRAQFPSGRIFLGIFRNDFLNLFFPSNQHPDIHPFCLFNGLPFLACLLLPSICWSVYPTTHPFVCPSNNLPDPPCTPSFCLSVQSVHLLVYPWSLCLSVSPSFHLTLSIHLSVQLSSHPLPHSYPSHPANLSLSSSCFNVCLHISSSIC